MSPRRDQLLLLILCLQNVRQIARYLTKAGTFARILAEVETYDIHNYFTPMWEKTNAELRQRLLPRLRLGFLREPLIRNTMVYSPQVSPELSFLEDNCSRDELQGMLREDAVGLPVLTSRRYLTSMNRIHHLYHLKRYLVATKNNIDSMAVVIEWGGGYGDLVRVFCRLKSVSPTYIVIDTPLFCSIQYIYLSAIMETQHVHLCSEEDCSIRKGAINIAPLGLISKVDFPKPDLFISTWALSESSEYAQDHVLNDRNMFGAERWLLAYQQNNKNFSSAERIGEITKERGASIVPIEFLPGNYYCFR